MTSDDQHSAVEAARVCAGLSVQQLWLRYLALGGSSDAFDIDGYLQGLVPLATFQRDVLAQAVNEGLDDLVDSLRVPLSCPTEDAAGDSALREVIDRLLAIRPNGARADVAPSADASQPSKPQP